MRSKPGATLFGHIETDSRIKHTRLTAASLGILELPAGQDLKEMVFKLVPNAVITGRILDEDGDPLADASVDCMKFGYDYGKRQFSPQGSATTNEVGEFRLVVEWARKCVIKATGPLPKMYQVAEERPVAAARAKAHAGDQKYVPTYYPNTANPNAASILDVPAGAQIAGINITLLRANCANQGSCGEPRGMPGPIGRGVDFGRRTLEYDRPGGGLARSIPDEWCSAWTVFSPVAMRASGQALLRADADRSPR